ncbi:hypothetical protein PRIC1_002108 [Phytophthora ramorum]
MRSARLLLALTNAGARRVALSSQLILRKPLPWRALSSTASRPPSNPFEIDLNALQTPISTTENFTADDAKRAAVAQQIVAQREIDLLHDEMSSLFGEEVAEYGADNSSPRMEDAVAAFEQSREEVVVPEPASVRVEQPPVLMKEEKEIKPKKRKETKVSSGETKVSGQSDHMVDVLLLQGPCSFVRNIWTGGDVKREELQQQIQDLADKLEIVVKNRNYDSETIILKMLLEAREDQVVVLCWNISLSQSPFIVHALELIRSRVIIVSPSNVEHGPLPANVVGVLSGFRNHSLSLALNAAVNLRGTGVGKTSSAGKEPPHKTKAKKKVLTCFLCGETGHIRSKCPQLPRNKT